MKSLTPIADFVPRAVFPPHNVNLAKFQGHHRKALQNLRALAFRIDMVVELRDSRAPISTINPLFDQVLAGRRKLILYTKPDLSTLKHSDILKWHPTQDFMRIECGEPKDGRRVLKYLKEAFTTRGPQPPLGYHVLITGMPNCGKSTLINTLRRAGLGKTVAKAARTGNLPGITRNMSETIRIANKPEIMVYDTPGVFVPQVADSTAMMNLSLTNSVNTEDIDSVLLADYLLYQLNLAYPDGKKYPGDATNDVDQLLRQLAHAKHNKTPFKREMIANEWLTKYRNGGIARLCLDDVSIENYRTTMERGASLRIDLGMSSLNSPLRKRLMN